MEITRMNTHGQMEESHHRRILAHIAIPEAEGKRKSGRRECWRRSEELLI